MRWASMDQYSRTELVAPEPPAELSAAHISLFLDFDGTLVELAERPELVVVPADLPPILTQLEQRLGGALAIVTGRALGTLDELLAPARLTVAAAHGTEGRLPGGEAFGPSEAAVAEADRIFAQLASRFVGEPRVILEKKAGAVALHYRQVPELEGQCREAINAVVGEAEGFHIVEGKFVFEVRPSGTDKGTAVAALMQLPPFRGRTPVFFGDDRTDEDGFAAVQALGGLGVKVGVGQTSAHYRTNSVTSMRELLDRMVQDDFTFSEHLTSSTAEQPA